MIYRNVIAEIFVLWDVAHCSATIVHSTRVVMLSLVRVCGCSTLSMCVAVQNSTETVLLNVVFVFMRST